MDRGRQPCRRRCCDLLALHQRRLFDASPPGASFALNLSGLSIPEVTIFAARRNGILCGVAALMARDDGSGEIKSMRTADDALRSGVAAGLLGHILEEARHRGMAILLLETGTGADFEAANALCRRHGFVRRGPFGDYTVSDFNVFYERPIKRSAP